MRYCSNCGHPLEENTKFCGECGTPVEAVQTEPAAEQQIPAFTPAAATAASAVAARPATAAKPAQQLRTNRGLLKYILLSIITLGIYGIVVMSHITEEINLVATRHDGKKTMHYCLVFFLFSWMTCGIVPLVWMHRLSNRMGNELSYRGLDYHISAGTFWGWGILGAFIVVGPFIFYHKFFKAMNLINADYNVNG